MVSQTGFHYLSVKWTFFPPFVSVRGWGKKFSQLPDKEWLYLKRGWKHKCWLSEWKNLIKFPKEQDTTDIIDWLNEAGKYSISHYNILHLVMPVLALGCCPGIRTMAWQPVNYFAIADVEFWGVKVSLPRWCWEKNQSNHCISLSMRTSLFMNMVKILEVRWSQYPKQHLIDLWKCFFNTTDWGQKPNWPGS